MKNFGALKLKSRLEICILKQRDLLKRRMDKYSNKVPSSARKDVTLYYSREQT